MHAPTMTSRCGRGGSLLHILPRLRSSPCPTSSITSAGVGGGGGDAGSFRGGGGSFERRRIGARRPRASTRAHSSETTASSPSPSPSPSSPPFVDLRCFSRRYASSSSPRSGVLAIAASSSSSSSSCSSPLSSIVARPTSLRGAVFAGGGMRPTTITRSASATAAASSSSAAASAAESSDDDDDDDGLLLRPNPYDESDDWRDWLRGEEYVDPWASSSSSSSSSSGSSSSAFPSSSRRGVEDLDYSPLDVSTRYLLELLDDAAEGVRRGADRATAERCFRAIERLSDKSLGGKRLTGRAQRADAILRRMERCERLHLAAQSGDHPLLRHEPPLPDRQLYYKVLLLFARESGPRELAVRAESIAETTVEKFPEFRSRAMVWNQVLSCWAVSTDAEKAVKAATFLGKMKERAAATAGTAATTTGADDGGDGDGSGGRVEGKGSNDDGLAEEVREEGQAYVDVDASSYGHVLRACALSSDMDDASSSFAPAPARAVPAEVALRVWKDYVDRSDLPLTSHSVAFLLQTISGCLPKGNPRAVRAVDDAFRRCRKAGVVNAHVLHRLGEAVRALALDEEALRNIVEGEKELAEGLQRAVPAITLSRKVPTRWTVNASAKTQWGW